MADLALANPSGELGLADPQLRKARERIRDARRDRKPYEATWHSNAAFASGKTWMVWDPNTRILRRIQDMDPVYRDRELYSVDICTEYRTTALGELGSDDERPELLLEQDDRVTEEYQAQANRALGYGWDLEWDGDSVLAEADRLCVDFGTSAIRCRFDPTVGDVKADNVPYQQGKPVLAVDKATELFGEGPNPDVTMGAIKEGRIVWEALSAFNLLPPPGVADERKFPWLGVVSPAYLPTVQDEYGPVAADLKEDQDISSTLGTEATSRYSAPEQWATGESRQQRLKDHVWLFTYYEMATSQFPKGRVIVFAGNQMKPIAVEEQLPYIAPDGSYRSGVAFFHWWRVSGRFWSRALIEPLKDPQRGISKRRTQSNEIIDRGMPFVLVPKGSEATSRKGTPLEVIEVDFDGRTGSPIVNQGVGPGVWMKQDVDAMREDAERGTGIRAPSLGENPQNVGTYSQLALIHEADATKRLPMHRARKLAIAQLVEDSVYDIRTYWGRDKKIMLAGDEHKVQAELFDATLIPPFYMVKVAKGEAKPRTQAAELKLVEDVAQYSLNSQQPVPVSWFMRSLQAGEPLDLPEQPSDDQADKAGLENHLLMLGRDVPVAYYDPPLVHIPIHRAAQIEAELTGDMDTWARIEHHVQEHLTVAQQNAPPPLPGGPQPGPPVQPQPPGAPQPPEPATLPGIAGQPPIPAGPPGG